jgi:hypothetical protein
MVKEGGQWKYVFAYSSDRGGLITTDKRKFALNATHALAFFQSKYANHEFKAGEKTSKPRAKKGGKK